MGRFLRLLVTRRWGWALIGALVIAGGVLWGASSPTIPYQSGLNNEYYITATASGDVYIWTTDQANPTFYVARAGDFNPPIDRTKIHLDSRLSFVARSDTISVDVNLVNKVHASQAHVIEQLTIYDASGKVTGSYSASDYNPNSNSYFDDRWWPGGSAAIFAGLLVAYVALFARRKKPGQAVSQAEPGWPFKNIPPYPTTAQAQSSQSQQPPQP